MKEKLKGAFQQFAGAMMVPIIVLVMAGFCVGFGAPLANILLEKGSFLQIIFSMISNIGSMVMKNLPFWFVIGISFGLAKQEKGWAAFSGFIMYMLVNVCISTYAGANGFTAESVTVKNLVDTMGYTVNEAKDFSSLWTQIGGIFTLDMSIFGALVIGIVTGIVHNKMYALKLPNFLSYFAGPRSVIMIAPLIAIVLGIMFYYVWPFMASIMRMLATLISTSGLFGTFLYGASDRALLPTGLHHLITLPLRYTDLGGSMMVDGTLYEGINSINMALTSSVDATGYLIRDFTSGRILSNFGSLPGAALAMYVCARKENRKKAAAILIPVVATAFLVGITEPVEFTILFASPLLYFLVHVPLSGLAFVLTELTKVSIQGFATVFMIPNLLQPDKVHAMSLLVLIPLFFAMYFFIFRWAILKFDIKTPGRKEKEGFKLVGKKDLKKDTLQNKDIDIRSMEITENLGGKENIVLVENCATRLRVSVVDSTKVSPDEVWMESLGAMGVVKFDKKYQIIFGPQVISIASDLKKYLGIS
ncbi:PTS transporter subunit EIIC [Amedibacillus sp. YH-ame10]